MTEEKLAQAVSCTEGIFLRRLPRPDQIPQRLVCGIRHPDRRHVACPVTPRQFDRIAPIDRPSITRFDGHQRRSHDLAPHPQRHQLPIDDVPRRTGFVTHPSVASRPQLLHQPSD